MSGASASSVVVSLGVWHELQLHSLVADTASTQEVWLDGAKVAQLSKTTALGVEPIGQIDLGDSSSAHVFDVAFDDVVADTGFVDTTSPTTPTGLATTSVLSNRVDLAWNPSTDAVGTDGYTIYRDGAPIDTVGGGTTTYTDPTVSPLSVYSYVVDAFDAAGNHSAPSPPLVVNTPNIDTSAPTTPRAFAARGVFSSVVTLWWKTSTDDVGVVGYTVYRSGIPIATVSDGTTAYMDNTVAPDSQYDYAVDAFDDAGNHSLPTATIHVSTAGPDPMIAAVGDIACDPADPSFNGGNGTATGCRQRYTSDLVAGVPLAAVLALGDEQYVCGGYQAFLHSYDRSWGRVLRITHPVLGNHEYDSAGGTDCDATGQAAGYFSYFGSYAGPTTGYYSYEIGSWHVIALNANCGSVPGGCGRGSLQDEWLRADLAAHPATCTLAYWHQPRFSSGYHGNNNNTQQFWEDLYAAGADLVLNGHSHDYERFAPQNPARQADPLGIREMIVGTGGADQIGFNGRTKPNSEVRNSGTFGILELTLHQASYDWTFVPEAGGTFTDSGSTACHQ